VKRVVGILIGLSLAIPALRFETVLMDQASAALNGNAPSAVASPLERLSSALSLTD
jgi:hypothetical protein